MIDTIMANLRSLYGWRAATILGWLYADAGYNPTRYYWLFWRTNDLSTITRLPLRLGGRLLVDFVRLGMAVQLVGGIVMAIYGAQQASLVWLYFGLAAVVAYPVVWAHLLPVLSLVGIPFRLKAIGKAVLCVLLERQVKQLRKRHSFAIVAVAGSVGKTSTKLAIANALAGTRRVQYQSGNYNDRLTVPLVVFGHEQPGLYNAWAWLKILLHNRRAIRPDYPYDVVVLELGTDGPGQMRHFTYLRPDVTVLSSIAPEHMEQFGTLDAVAAEELTLFDYSKKVLVNTDDTPKQYLAGYEYVAYGAKPATYAGLSNKPAKTFGKQQVSFDLAGQKLTRTIEMVGQQGAKIALAAAAVACELALPIDDVKVALDNLRPFAGRMQLLPGIRKSILIDDTYNASPMAVSAALEVLKNTAAPQRIAILGSMNELGDSSAEAHTAVGEQCDPSWLDLVVTIGTDAAAYTAPAAADNNCVVQSFDTPTAAGEYVKKQLKSGAVVLAKGSQNGVFAEEALKVLLKDKSDSEKLVRQTAYWLRVKRSQFGD